MKPVKLLLFAAFATWALSSCKKDKEATDTETTVEATFELTADNSTADFMAEDDNDVLMEVASDQNVLGNFAPTEVETNNVLACATVTVTPQAGFPKTIVILFDSTCVGRDGIRRGGTVRLVISDSLRKPGSTAVMTFENYFVNRFKREGKHTFTNTSQAGSRSWERKIEGGKITAPGGRFWLHESLKNTTQTAGIGSMGLLDDVFSMTGHARTTNMLGESRTATITEPLQKKYACHNIDSGRIRFEAPNHFAILDYGNGVCDRIAVISINGRPPRTILLP